MDRIAFSMKNAKSAKERGNEYHFGAIIGIGAADYDSHIGSNKKMRKKAKERSD